MPLKFNLSILTLFIEIIDREFLLVTLAIFLFVCIVILRQVQKKWKWLAFILMLLAVLNVIMGNRFKNSLIYRYGEAGTAVVTGKEATNNLHNAEPVIRHYVLLTTAEGETMATHFDNWDINIYPSPAGGRYQYPDPGAEFGVRYMPKNPDQFVILGE